MNSTEKISKNCNNSIENFGRRTISAFLALLLIISPITPVFSAEITQTSASETTPTVDATQAPQPESTTNEVDLGFFNTSTALLAEENIATLSEPTSSEEPTDTTITTQIEKSYDTVFEPLKTYSNTLTTSNSISIEPISPSSAGEISGSYTISPVTTTMTDPITGTIPVLSSGGMLAVDQTSVTRMIADHMKVDSSLIDALSYEEDHTYLLFTLIFELNGVQCKGIVQYVEKTSDSGLQLSDNYEVLIKIDQNPDAIAPLVAEPTPVEEASNSQEIALIYSSEYPNTLTSTCLSPMADCTEWASRFVYDSSSQKGMLYYSGRELLDPPQTNVEQMFLNVRMVSLETPPLLQEGEQAIGTYLDPSKKTWLIIGNPLVTELTPPKPLLDPMPEVTDVYPDSKPLPIPPVVDPKVEAIKSVVTNDLVNSFGFTQEMLDDLIKSGLIKIEVDLANLKAKVTIDPRIQLPKEALRWTDPLGMHKLPTEIVYNLGDAPGIQMGMPCTLGPDGTADCPPPPQPTYYLTSGEFQIGSDYFVDMNYLDEIYVSDIGGDNRLHSVLIYDGDPTPICDGATCAARIPIKQITFKYGDGTIGIHIQYNATPNVASRGVELIKMEDGQYHIQNVVDYDKDGKTLATSRFVYLTAESAGPQGETYGPVVHLFQIIRTDANGNPLSEIKNIGPSPEAIPGQILNQATVVLPDGTEVPVIFNTFENLFDQALKIEAMHSEIEALRKDLLTKVDSEVANTQKTLEDLKAQLEAAKIQLAKDLDVMRSDAAEVKNQMFAWMNELKNLLKQEGLSDKTRKAITDLSSKMENYLDRNQPDNFDQLMNSYMDMISLMRLWSLNSQITMWEGYLGALSTYKNQVVGAKTLDELKALENQFPFPIPPPQIMPPLVNDPRELAKEYIADSMSLLEKTRDELNQYQAAQVVTNDLVNSFGFTKEKLDTLIKEGLIKIEVDRKSLTAKIMIDPSVMLPGQIDLTYLVDLLGNHKLPLEINYQLEASIPMIPMIACQMGYPCPNADPVYSLKSGSFNVGTNYFELNYIEDGIIKYDGALGDNRLHSVLIYDGDPRIVCVMAPCPTGVLEKEISYEYNLENKITALVHYHQTKPTDVLPFITHRKMAISRMLDQKLHITHMDEYNGEQLVASNEFGYLVWQVMIDCMEGAICIAPPAGVHLYEIKRTNANGDLLSRIQGLRLSELKSLNAPKYQATVHVKEEETVVYFNTLEELMAQAMKIENQNPADLEALRTRLLTKTDVQIEETKKLIDALNAKLEQAKIDFEKRAAEIRAEMQILWNQIADSLPMLQKLASQVGVSEETKKAISDYVSRMQNSYLTPNGLEQAAEGYIRFFQMVQVGFLEEDIQNAKNYLGDLESYKEKVETAQTLEELKTLVDHFPVQQPIMRPMFMPPMDPFVQAKQYIEEGKTLAEKAMAEMKRKNFLVRSIVDTRLQITETRRGLLTRLSDPVKKMLKPISIRKPVRKK